MEQFRAGKAKLLSSIRIRRPIVRECLAEFLGTFILMLFGDASVAQYVYAPSPSTSTFLTINLAWGIAVTMGVYVSGGVSGGHINPAVSLALAMIGKFPFWKVPIYFLGQYLGAFFAAAVVRGVYYDAQLAFEGSNFSIPGTAGIYATYPSDYLSAGNGLGDQVVATALLMLCILAVTDTRNMGAPKGLAPFVIGLIVTVIGMSFGLNCGYAINPARDLGPRIFTAIAGWGEGVFTYRNRNWFWVPIIGPHIGAILGAWIYILGIGLHLAEEGGTTEPASIDTKVELDGIENDNFDGAEGGRPAPTRL